MIYSSKCVTLDTFDLPHQLISEDIFDSAKKLIKKIALYKTPRDKLVCIVNACKLVAGMLA